MLPLPVIGVVILVLIICVASTLKRYIRSYYYSFQFSGPTAWPFIGSAFLFLNKTPQETFPIIEQYHKTYGEIWRILIGLDVTFVVADPIHAEAILTSHEHIDKSSDYDKLIPWLNTGLLLSTGKKWHQRRKLITPAFHFKILEQFVDIFERQGNIFIDNLRKYVEQSGSVEIGTFASLYALDVICETAMGTRVNAQCNSTSDYVKAVKEETRIIQIRSYNFLLHNDFIFKYSAMGERQRNALSVLHNFTSSVIRKRRNELTEKSIASTVNDWADDNNQMVGIKCKETLIDILLKSTVNGQTLTDAEIQEEVDTFMFEGHDTTASAITFILYNIAKYPSIQEQCYREIVDYLGADPMEPLSYSQLTNLPYLEKVIKETLRLYPSVPIFGRNLKQDLIIDNKLYPAGCDLMINVYAMGRNEKYFPQPNRFWPERFDGGNNSNDNAIYAFIPFSAGPRNCVGQKFAMLEMKSIVIKILRNFRIALNSPDSISELKLYAELVLRPIDKILLDLSPRVNR